MPDWLASHHDAFTFASGVTSAVVCDQFKSGVTTACRCEAGLQRTYEEFVQHYGAADNAQVSYCNSFRLCEALRKASAVAEPLARVARGRGP